jgi:hypothetical protein
MPVMRDEQGAKPIKDLRDANLIGEDEIGPNSYARCVNFRSQPSIYSESRLSTDTPTPGRPNSRRLPLTPDIESRYIPAATPVPP